MSSVPLYLFEEEVLSRPGLTEVYDPVIVLDQWRRLWSMDLSHSFISFPPSLYNDDGHV